MENDTMTKMKCIHCGAIFNLEDISRPMKTNKGEPIGDFVWIADCCPACHEGMDDWYEKVRE